MTKKEESLAVIHRHLEEAKTRVIDRVAYNFAEDAVVFNNLIYTPLIGKEMIREFCKVVMLPDPYPDFDQHLQVLAMTAEDEFASIIYHVDPVIPLGVDTFLIQNDRIAFETATQLRRKGVYEKEIDTAGIIAVEDPKSILNRETESFVRKHMDNLCRFAMEENAEDYTDDIIFLTNKAKEASRGKEAVSAVYADMKKEMESIPLCKADFIIKVYGNIILCYAQSPTQEAYIIVTCVLEDGKIKYESVSVRKGLK